MHFMYSFVWDKGDYYAVNQDSIALRTIMTGSGPYAAAIVCDGVGSLDKGEYASGVVTKVMMGWFQEHALELLCRNMSAKKILRSCNRALEDVHNRLKDEGEKKGLLMGSTFSLILLGKGKYYYFHVGDCFCYRLGRKNMKLSIPQVNLRGELTGVIGINDYPELFYKTGRYTGQNRFLLGSDGFERCLTAKSLEVLWKGALTERETERLMKEILSRGRKKGERDNCTGVVISIS